MYWNAKTPSIICQSNLPTSTFQFDRVFDGHESNEDVYSAFCAPLVKSVIEGMNGTIFAYGQTSSGKTYTMMGAEEEEALGIIHFTVSDIFHFIQNMPDREFLLRVSYLEIYNEMVLDLLSDKMENLKLQEDQYGMIKVANLSEHIVQEAKQVLELMKRGDRKRSRGETLMNDKSSRSHSIFRMIIESGLKGVENAVVNVSQFNLVDLAGSERAKQTGAKGARFKESININKSLLMLSQVISQLSEKDDHQYINFRDSKITRILQNSLGGNARTAIICTVTPAALEETISTLKFATRAKCIKNKPQVNEVLTEQALLKRYANKIKKLTEELEAAKEEAQENKNLKQEIQNLKMMFVTRQVPEIKARVSRRETWGGCLDAARLGLLPQQRIPLVSVDLEGSYTRHKGRSSFNPRNSVLLPDLPTLDEEAEFDLPVSTDTGDAFSRQSSRFSEAICDKLFTNEVYVQTDGDTRESDLEKLQSEEIKSLRKELTELREFTTWERQVLLVAKKNSVENGKVDVEEYSTLANVSNFEDLKNGNSSSPIKHFRHSLDKHMRVNDLMSNSFTWESNVSYKDDKLNSTSNHPDYIKLLDYLKKALKEVCSWHDIDELPYTSKLNGQNKIILDMFNFILQQQCKKLKSTHVSSKSTDISSSLMELLMAFNSNQGSSETLNMQLMNFINATDSILDDLKLDSLNLSPGNFINQSLVPENMADISCFDIPDVANVSNLKQQNATLGSPSIELRSPQNRDFFRSQSDFQDLQEQIENLKKQISDLNSESEIKENENLLLNDIMHDLESQIEISQSSISAFKVELETKNKDMIEFNRKHKQIQSALMEEVEKQKALVLKLEGSCEEKDKQILSNFGKYQDTEISLQKEVQNLSETISELKHASEMKERELLEKELLQQENASKQIDSNKYLVSEMRQKFEFQEKKLSSLNEKFRIDTEALVEELKLSKDLISELKLNSEQIENKVVSLNDKLVSKEQQLRTETAKYERTISDFKYNCDLKDKQISILNDKVKVQDHIIVSLQDEISLSGDMSKIETYDSFSQTDEIIYPAGSSDKPVMEDNLEAILQNITDLKVITLRLMNQEMEKEFLNDSLEAPENSSLSDQIMFEINALKLRVNRIEFFIKTKSDLYKHFTPVLETKMQEVLSLNRQITELESNLSEKDSTLSELTDALLNFKDEICVMEDLRAFSVEQGLNDLHNLTSSPDEPLTLVESLKRAFSVIELFIINKDTLMEDLSHKLANANIALEEFKNKYCPYTLETSSQTEQDTEMVVVSRKLKESHLEIEELKSDIQELNGKIQLVLEEKVAVSQLLDSQVSLHRTKLQNLIAQHEEELASCIAKSKECVKNIEDKYNQELVEQENKFFTNLNSKLNELRDEHKNALLRKDNEFKETLRKMQLFNDEKLEKCLENHKKDTSQLHSKLSQEIEEKFKVKQKLEDELRTMKKEAHKKDDLYSHVRNKFKLYIEETQSLKMNLKKEERDGFSQTDVLCDSDNKQEPCGNCKELTNQVQELKTIIHNQNCAPTPEGDAVFKKLNFELDSKKAKILSLETNNKNMVKEIVMLKKDLNSKSGLLRSCQCRLLFSKGGPEKKKQEETDMTQSSKIRDSIATFENVNILQLDIVQRAIEDAKEAERALLCSTGIGPANQIKCLYLEKQLAKTEKNLENAMKELSDVKAGKFRKNICQTISGPSKASSDYCEANFSTYGCSGADHPFPGESVPKAPSKKILTERNKKITPSSYSKPKEDDAVVLSEPDKKLLTPAEQENKGIRNIKQQLGLLSDDPSVPECKQQ